MQVNLSQGSGMSYSQMMQSMDAMHFSQVKFRQNNFNSYTYSGKMHEKERNCTDMFIISAR
jgi:hypothetical protein